MPTLRAWGRREIGVHIKEARARDVSLEVQLSAALRLPELPATVDELVLHPAASLPGSSRAPPTSTAPSLQRPLAGRRLGHGCRGDGGRRRVRAAVRKAEMLVRFRAVTTGNRDVELG